MKVEEKVIELISGIDFSNKDSAVVKTNLTAFDEIIDKIKLEIDFLSLGCKDEKVAQLASLYKSIKG